MVEERLRKAVGVTQQPQCVCVHDQVPGRDLITGWSEEWSKNYVRVARQFTDGIVFRERRAGGKLLGEAERGGREVSGDETPMCE